MCLPVITVRIQRSNYVFDTKHRTFKRPQANRLGNFFVLFFLCVENIISICHPYVSDWNGKQYRVYALRFYRSATYRRWQLKKKHLKNVHAQGNLGNRSALRELSPWLNGSGGEAHESVCVCVSAFFTFSGLVVIRQRTLPTCERHREGPALKSRARTGCPEKPRASCETVSPAETFKQTQTMCQTTTSTMIYFGPKLKQRFIGFACSSSYNYWIPGPKKKKDIPRSACRYYRVLKGTELQSCSAHSGSNSWYVFCTKTWLDRV